MKKILNIFLALFTVTGLTSCLDEDPIFEGSNAPNVVEILYAGTGSNSSPSDAPYAMYMNSLQIVEPGATIDLPVYINYAGSRVAPQDIKVTVTLDDAAVEVYNEETGSHYEIMPDSLYEIPTMTVTIPKGERRVPLIIKVKTGDIDLNEEYALGMTITEASTGAISGNFKTAILRIGAKNKYEGVYKNTYTSSLGNGINDVDLITTGPNSVTMYLIGVYSNQVGLLIDPVTNKVTVSMTSLLPIATDPSSYYDPETKTFHLKWTSNGGARTFNQKLVMIEEE